MSTRGNICIKVLEKDFNKVNEKISSGSLDPKISKEYPYLYIYNHFDSYPTGLGKRLLKDYNFYNHALELILEGDCSYPGDSYTSKGEEYESNKPRVVNSIEKANQEEYLYVFENNTWNCYDYNMNKVYM